MKNAGGAPAGQQADAIVALRAAGRSRASLRPRLASLGRQAPSYARTAGGAAKVVMAAVAAGRDPRRLAGVNYLARVRSRYASGRYGATAFDQALSLLAVSATGATPPRSAVRATLAARGRGGWSFDLTRKGRDTVDVTALVIEALAAAGVPASNPGLRAGAAWMLAQRNKEGGVRWSGHGGPTEANSTAGVIRALRALGRTPPASNAGRAAPVAGRRRGAPLHAEGGREPSARHQRRPDRPRRPLAAATVVQAVMAEAGRIAAVSTRLTFQSEIEHFRTGLVEMASLVLSQVERGVAAWEDVDGRAADEVIAADEQVDQRCAELDHKVFSLQLLQAPVAGDQRLLHVGLIAVIALERVGDLAVAISQAAKSVRPEGAVPEIQAMISRMSARAVDTLARAVQAIARGDAELGEQAAVEAATVRQMLGDVVARVASAPDEPETRVWSATAVLVSRHLERVANNGAELGGRVRFLVTGEAFTRDG